MKYRLFLCLLFYWTVSTALLLQTYPLGVELTFSYPRWVTVGSYVALSILISFIAIVVSPAIVKFAFPRTTSAITGVLVTIATLFFLIVLSISFGPFGLDLPIFRIRGIFFAEWEFMRFLIYDGILLSLIAGLVAWLFLGRVRTLPESNPNA